MHPPFSRLPASGRLPTLLPGVCVRLLSLLLLLLLLLPAADAIASSANATWDPATFDYCAANPAPHSINGTAAANTPCYTDQVLTRQNTSTSYATGGTAIMYMKFVTTGPLGGANYTSTAVFYPVVDDYSELQIPNSWSKLRQNTTTLHSPQISLELLYAGNIYALPYKRWAVLQDATVLYVPSRTAIITLDNGVLTSFDWFSTTCTLSTCTCLDSICTESCPGANCPITAFVGWSGTDAGGQQLTSSQRDIWRFQNAF
ncbi:hypothetical protein HDU88_000561 [Geranomyces variabilis]|nr:hypothetical protein HDU88_000561 [Geranomyces variabilis]